MDRRAVMIQFETYASAYDLKDAKVLLKYIHTGKVAENCDRIAKSLGMSEEDCDTAWLIGMLHDIGRFEQLRRYDTFMDSVSIDHAEFGADLLFQEGLAERFGLEHALYGLIEKAVRYHSRYRLPEDLTERELVFCQIIRDADKVDIFRANYETGMEAIYNVTAEELRLSPITAEVLEAFMEGHAVLRSLKKTTLDHLVGHLALSFELVYPESRIIAREQGYLKKLAEFESENPDTQRKMVRIRERLEGIKMSFTCDTVRPVILFDLDGTLLPMDLELFEKKYFSGLSQALPQIPPRDLVKIVWAGTKMMIVNDGSKANREAFAEKFTELTGLDYWACEPVFEKYYETEFQKCAEVCGVTELSREIVHTLQEKGYTVAIATNPLFPKIATYSRLRWLGLSAEEFPLVTTFEDSHYCKPNPDYYREVCRRLDVKPEDCIMIGNDVEEDGVAASVGMQVMLVTDCLLNKKDLPTDAFELGTMQELLTWAKALPQR